MKGENYLVATLKPWHRVLYERVIKHYPGQWQLVTEPHELTIDLIESFNPKYIFFPHWSHIVPNEIIDEATCICFHETDLPYGRGGSPIQNLIEEGHRDTVISALKMTSTLDAGPIYLQLPLSLEGLAEEIYLRSAAIVAEMIHSIITENPKPVEQKGDPLVFRRRTPEQSSIPIEGSSLSKLHDHIRMLDAEGYPRAFLEIGDLRLEFSRPSLKTGEIFADVRITTTDKLDDD